MGNHVLPFGNRLWGYVQIIRQLFLRHISLRAQGLQFFRKLHGMPPIRLVITYSIPDFATDCNNAYVDLWLRLSTFWIAMVSYRFLNLP